MSDSIRLIHATRLLLDEPVLGAGALSGEERRLVEDATITAFHRIVEACVDKQADILILSGDTFDETSFTLRARATLMDGLETLTDDGVSVFITPGMMDSLTSWRRLGTLPEGVTLLGADRQSSVEITEKGRVIAVVSHLTPGTAAIDPPSSKLSAVQIGIIPEGDVPPGGIEAWLTAPSGWNYIALGGGDTARTVRLSHGIAHAPGTPQPLRAGAYGVHGATFVELDTTGVIHQEQIRTATVRWERNAIECSTSTSWEELTEKLALTLLEYETHPVETIWNFEWVLRGRGDLYETLADPRRQKDLWDTIDREARSTDTRRRHTLIRESLEIGREHEAADLMREFSDTVTGVLNPQDPFWKKRGQLLADLTTPWGRKLNSLVEQADIHSVADQARQLARSWWT